VPYRLTMLTQQTKGQLQNQHEYKYHWCRFLFNPSQADYPVSEQFSFYSMRLKFLRY
jgi:hypothetical protein